MSHIKTDEWLDAKAYEIETALEKDDDEKVEAVKDEMYSFGYQRQFWAILDNYCETLLKYSDGKKRYEDFMSRWGMTDDNFVQV